MSNLKKDTIDLTEDCVRYGKLLDEAQRDYHQTFQRYDPSDEQFLASIQERIDFWYDRWDKSTKALRDLKLGFK